MSKEPPKESGIWRVRFTDDMAQRLGGTKIEIIEWQAKSGDVVFFGSEEYASARDIEEWIEKVADAKDW